MSTSTASPEPLSFIPLFLPPGVSVRELALELSTYHPTELRMADPANHPTYMTHATTLSEISLTNLRENAKIPEEFNVVLPGPRDRPRALPPNYVTFFVDQLEAGLRFPIPDLFFRISKSFSIPLMQLVPNSFRLMVGFWMVVSYFGYEPTHKLWRAFFHAKTTSPGLFYFTSQGAAKFLQEKPSSLKVNELGYTGLDPNLDRAVESVPPLNNRSAPIVDVAGPSQPSVTPIVSGDHSAPPSLAFPTAVAPPDPTPEFVTNVEDDSSSLFGNLDDEGAAIEPLSVFYYGVE
ncbi:hypothetical protein Pfo_027418 [Paulownia fortunei]|nr:hypothetical protein Pfo_027418 [Paulownia fortunei]